MKKLYVVASTVFFFITMGGGTAIQAQQNLQAPLWGNLSAGSYAVGFKNVYQFDRRRTWRTTHGNDRPFAPDLSGRPIRISIWYPAIRDNKARQLRFEDYVNPTLTKNGPNEFAELNHILELREKIASSPWLPSDRWPDLMATSMNAFANATPASGRFPLILHFGGLNATSTTRLSVLGEFLASHGYVVATVPLLGPTNEDTEQGRKPQDRERTVQDLEFAWSILRTQPNVDETRVGVFGHSLGGIEAVIFAMRNANVSAVIGLDGTYGFKGLGKFLSEIPDYAPQKMRAAFLDLRRDWKDLDLSAEHAFRYSDRTFITIKKMHHGDFHSYTAVAFKFHMPVEPNETDDSGWSRETGYRGYQEVCWIVLDFFDAKLKGDRGAPARMMADVSHAEGGVLKHEDAVAPPLSGIEFAALIGRQGFDAATAIVDRYRREIPDEPVVDEEVFNDLGYRLIADGRFSEAIGIMRLILYAYPNSTNAADGLADAYIAGGQKGLARGALEHALKLISADTSLNEGQKQSLARGEQTKLDQLKP